MTAIITKSTDRIKNYGESLIKGNKLFFIDQWVVRGGCC